MPAQAEVAKEGCRRVHPRPQARVQIPRVGDAAQLGSSVRGWLSKYPHPVPPGAGAVLGHVDAVLRGQQYPGRHRPPLPHERGHHRVLGQSGDEVRSAIYRIDHPGGRRVPERGEEPRVVSGRLLADDRSVYQRAEARRDVGLRLTVSDGDYLAGRLPHHLAVSERTEPRQDGDLGGLPQDVGYRVDLHERHGSVRGAAGSIPLATATCD
jgi:hypothetical protein